MRNVPDGRFNTRQITSGIEERSLALKTISFVREQLPLWRDDPDRPYELSEDKLTEQLCKYLDAKARTDFPMVRFNHEESQAASRSVDVSTTLMTKGTIGARDYTIYDPFLVLECKRLPAPSNDRQREYLSGDNSHKRGGIQRFKLCLHGAELDLVAMIAYVQERSTAEWQKEINGWISDLCASGLDGCTWTADEMLELLHDDQGAGLGTCRSIHSREGPVTSDIEIRHLWILMNGNRATLS